MSTEATETPEGARKWNIPQSLLDRCVAEMEKALTDGTLRDKQTTATILKGMVESNLKHDEFDDKRERLDSGKPTEISDLGSLGAAALDLTNRIGAAIGNEPEDDERVVRVVEGGGSEVQGLPSGAEPSDLDEEATRRA